jgi:predicted nucleic acid-binding protein
VIRATLDVNVLASGLPAATGPPAELIDRWGEFTSELVVSEHILTGLLRAWQKLYFQTRYLPQQVAEAVVRLRAQAILVVPVSAFRGIGHDVEDDLIPYQSPT